MRYLTVPELFNKTCDKWGSSKVSFRYKQNDEWISLNYDQLRDKVFSLALAFMELGIHKGDKIGIASENRIEWIISSFAISLIGAIDVPIFPILTAKQEEYIFSHSEVSAIIVSNNFQLKKVLEFKDNIPSLRHIIVMNDDYDRKNVFVRSISELIQRGASLRNKQERDEIIFDCCNKVNEDDLLTIIYTSGTTGNPKGVMLTHKNVVSNAIASLKAFG
ncbi:MAG TPA: AMP-binding protein, partial [Candidatus Kapabacteria bacterium]|nr:AMP-binding protein [Candidatus Kapabacteria bacterium]